MKPEMKHRAVLLGFFWENLFIRNPKAKTHQINYGAETSIAEVHISGRVKDPEGKKHVAQQLSAALNNSEPHFDLKTGQLKSKKVPKEKTPEENAMKDLKSLQKKSHDMTYF